MGYKARKLLQFLRGGDGTTAVEYAVLISLVLLISIGGINAIRRNVAAPIEHAAGSMQYAGTVTPAAETNHRP